MRPPKNRRDDFEKVPTNDFVAGRIVDIELDEKHKFNYKGQESLKEAVRFVFEVDGCQYKHKSSWMQYNYGSKSNLFSIFLNSLVEGAEPDMDFDLDRLKGLDVKILWNETDRGFQYVETIRPANRKVARPLAEHPHPKVEEEEPPTPGENEMQF